MIRWLSALLNSYFFFFLLFSAINNQPPLSCLVKLTHFCCSEIHTDLFWASNYTWIIHSAHMLNSILLVRLVAIGQRERRVRNQSHSSGGLPTPACFNFTWQITRTHLRTYSRLKREKRPGRQRSRLFFPLLRLARAAAARLPLQGASGVQSELQESLERAKTK